jgi:acyl-coenzyme A synthetase/AMP-(fatty) acid ligase
MVKRRGFRIELGEIESALHKHPGIAEAAAISYADATGDLQICAFYEWTDPAPPSLLRLKQFCAANLPHYMAPDRFVVLESLPKTSTDKIDYQRLKAMLP